MARPTVAARARRRRAGSRAAEARAGVAEAGAEDSSELLRRSFAVRDGLPAPAAEEGRGGGIRPGAVNPAGGGVSSPSPPLSLVRGQQRGGGEVEGEADVWAPHVSEGRERSSRGYFGPYENTRVCEWVQEHQRRIKWHGSKKRRIVMARFKIREL